MPESGAQMPNEQRTHISLRTTQPTHFGQGWVSGVASVLLGVLGLGAVFCFHFPSVLTMPQLRQLYPVPWIRALLHRSEEHTSELQSGSDLVCRLLLEKKNALKPTELTSGYTVR